METTEKSEYVFELKDVSYSYSRFQEPVLKNISFSVKRGEYVGIVGPTVSGKSTLLSLLTGVIPQYNRGVLQGEVLIFGKKSVDLKMAEITSRIGFVLQDPESQLFNLFVSDEIVWGLECRGVPREEMIERMNKTLEMFKIGYLSDRVTYDLSGGEKQKVAISSINIIGTEVMVFDNPTSQLDPLGRTMVHEAVRKLTDMGRTIIMVDDSLDDLITYADRIILIRDGSILLDMSSQEFCLQRELVHECGLRLPQVAELAHELIEEGIELHEFPITTEQAERVFGSILQAAKRGSDHDRQRKC